ncbi:hypothetical protein LZ32DRAFT_387892 [Colletotrichum eremochloae]|nr:hypothetical protein LZ32DRAFT_387892 [Colletotrichum eremochloae]
MYADAHDHPRARTPHGTRRLREKNHTPRELKHFGGHVRIGLVSQQDLEHTSRALWSLGRIYRAKLHPSRARKVRKCHTRRRGLIDQEESTFRGRGTWCSGIDPSSLVALFFFFFFFFSLLGKVAERQRCGWVLASGGMRGCHSGTPCARVRSSDWPPTLNSRCCLSCPFLLPGVYIRPPHWPLF